MMCCSQNCLHSIKIINLKENEEIINQFLLIKGCIENFKCAEAKDVSLSIEECEKQITKLSTTTGRFKFLVNLDLNLEKCREYILKFQYCKASTEIKVIRKPVKSAYKIQPLIVFAKDENIDEKFRLQHQQVIDLNLLLIQSVYTEKLRESLQQRFCFTLNDKCKIFNSHLTKTDIWKLNENELWSTLAKELLASEEWSQQSKIKFVAFIACSRYLGDEVAASKDFSYQNIRKHIQGHAALGAGGLALFSTTYFYAWPQQFDDILPCFENKKKLDLCKEPDESNYRQTYGGVYASSLGAVCHEIGHIFDLGHDLAGVMGSNFDYINHVFLVNDLTEHLPQRIVQKVGNENCAPRPRFTQLKKMPANGFLNSYREQKENDSFYFSTNSAIILKHHAWLRNDASEVENNDFELNFDKSRLIVESLKYPLIIIEIRTNSNSLVTEWLEFQNSVFCADLKKFRAKLEKDSHIFIMSLHGHTKKLYL